MSFSKTMLLATAFAGAALTRPALAEECHEPYVFLIPAVALPEGGTPEPFPFASTAKKTVTLKTTSCESPFGTVANEEVTFTWKLRAGTAKDMTFSIVGEGHTLAVTSGKPVTLPEGKWVFRIERPGLKDRRLDVLTFELTSRFKGEIMA